MTPEEAKAILDTISGHLTGKTGSISSISIRGGTAKVVIDIVTFDEVFTGQDTDQHGATVSKTVGVIKYMADRPGSSIYTPA